MKRKFIHAFVVAGAIFLTPYLRAQQDLIPELFPGVQIGSVVFDDGSVVRTQAFSLEQLASAIVVQNSQTQQQSISGNSSYNAGASANTLLGSLSFEARGKATIGSALTAETSSSQASQSQNIEMTSLFVGTNRLAYIDFQRLTPNSLMASLNSNLLQETSSLQELANGINALQQLLNTTPDPNTPVARQLIADIAAAQDRFRRNFGVGFVSGVVLGGAAAVRAEFASEAFTSQTRWNASGRIYGATIGARTEISSAFGTMNNDKQGEVSFSATSSSLGGSSYNAFADRFLALFTTPALGQLWTMSFAQLPSTAGLLGSQPPTPPPFPDPPAEVSGLADKFGMIKTKEQLDLYNQALAFDRWNKDPNGGNGNGTFEQFKAFLAEQQNAVLEENPIANEVLVVDNDEPLLPRSANDAAFAEEMLVLPRQVETSDPPVVEGLAALAPGARVSDEFQTNFWSDVQGDFEVIAVETTRWEDVIPGLGFADSLITNTVAGREFVQASRVLQAFREISNMYSLAASCVQDGGRYFASAKYVARANAFLRHERDLSAIIARQASPLPLVEKFLADLRTTDLAIYQVFVLNRDLFTAGEIGMGGYGVFRADDDSRDGALRRLGVFSSIQTGGLNGVRFNARWDRAGNSSLALHSPNLYAQAVKFFPLLEPDIEDFVADGENSQYRAKIRLMASIPDGRRSSSLAVNGFLARNSSRSSTFSSVPSDDIIEIPLEDVRDVPRFNVREFVLPLASDPSGDFAFNGANDPAPRWYSESEIFNRRLLGRWQGERLKEIRLVPFTMQDLVGIPNWRGFIAYEQQTQTVLEDFWQELTRNFVRIAPGVNYFTTVFASREINLDQAFDPADLAQFTSYIGLVPRPSTFAPQR